MINERHFLYLERKIFINWSLMAKLQEIKKSADSGTHMMTKRFHLQGFEYEGPYTGQVFQQLMSCQDNIFPPLVWHKLTDLSLLHFDWTSIHLPDLSEVRFTPNIFTQVNMFYPR